MKKPKVLKVIHGYPPYYMAGSEVYSRNIIRELSKHIDIVVFSRIENQFKPLYYLEESFDDGVKIYRINRFKRDYTFRDKYINEDTEMVFSKILEKEKPDIVHIGHLSHLSSRIPVIAKFDYGLPVIMTIHDFWLYCFRGQLINHEYKICMDYNLSCYDCAKWMFGPNVDKEDVRDRERNIKETIKSIDLFLSPSKTVREFFISNGVNENKINYSPYGFDKNKIKYRKRFYNRDSKIIFGYMGRIIPTKGIHILIKAFNKSNVRNILKIYGSCNSDKLYLRDIAGNKDNIVFMGGFDNDSIDKVLSDIDILIVPSIWLENSPLVIQEAFLAGIPVITSNIGGMKELVNDGINGFTFEVGNEDMLAELIRKISEEPEVLNGLSPNPDSIRSIQEDARSILGMYKTLLGISGGMYDYKEEAALENNL